MMQKSLGILALTSMAACSGGLTLPDFRGTAPRATPAVVVPPTPQPVLRTAKERLASAIENNGCTLTTDNVSAILTEATISRDELLQLTPQLVSEGRAELSGSGAISITSGSCAA